MNALGKQIQIRLATLADVPQLCDLLALLFSQEADFKPDAERQTRGLEKIIGAPGIGCVYCASQESLVVGMVSLLYSVSTAEGGLSAWLEDMVVHPDWRGNHLGEQLLKTAIQQSRDSGCLRITLLTDAHNDRAIRFYGRAVFISSSMIPLRLKL